MELEGAIVAVTGAGSGIGAALARQLADAGAAGVGVIDIDAAAAQRVAAEIGDAHRDVAVRAVGCDVADPAAITSTIDELEAALGAIDLWCSNAGVLLVGGVEVPAADWDRIWQINVAAHVHAARVLVPRMLARGGGHLLHTASAAGLLSQIGSGPYSVTKHAAVGLAEWLAITYGEAGIGVSVLCPQAVDTAMTAGIEGGGVAGVDGMLSADEVAAAAIAGVRDDVFLILPHPEVAKYVQRKAADPERWIRGMQRLQARFAGGVG